MSAPMHQSQHGYHKRTPRSGSWSDAATVLFPWSISLLVSVISFFIVMTYRSSYYSIQDTYVSADATLKEHERNYESMKRALKMAQKKSLTREEKETTERRDSAINKNIEMLEKYIQRESHRQIFDRFGHGPYRVQFEVELTKGEPTENFIVETAPLYMMPHAIHLFLEQVQHGLWNGCTFSENTGSILLASPSSLNGDDNLLVNFQVTELDTVSFQEYHDNFPHEKFTLGLAKRPGGPDFYINLKDNSESHGPYGQDHHILSEEADPCFARVITGFHVIEKMQQRPTQRGTFFMRERVLIKNAKIMEQPMYEA